MRFGDVQVRLVQQGRGAEGQSGGASTQMGLRQAVELVVERREQGIPCGGIAQIGACHDPGHLLDGILMHGERRKSASHAAGIEPAVARDRVDASRAL